MRISHSLRKNSGPKQEQSQWRACGAGILPLLESLAAGSSTHVPKIPNATHVDTVRIDIRMAVTRCDDLVHSANRSVLIISPIQTKVTDTPSNWLMRDGEKW